MPRNEDISSVQNQVDWAPKRLRELRESAGFSRDAVAKALDVHIKRVADIELGRYSLRWSTICRYLNVIGKTVDQWAEGCPGSFNRKRLPTALVRGQEVQFFLHQAGKLDADQLGELVTGLVALQKQSRPGGEVL